MMVFRSLDLYSFICTSVDGCSRSWFSGCHGSVAVMVQWLSGCVISAV